MPYVQRDKNGEIVALWKEKSELATELAASADPEVKAFVADGALPEAGEFSIAADLQMVRVIEDLINLLMTKGIIVLTDLPVAVQNKLLHQRARRERLLGSFSIISEGDKGLF